MFSWMKTKTYFVTVAVDRQFFPERVKLVTVSESAAAENEVRAEDARGHLRES